MSESFANSIIKAFLKGNLDNNLLIKMTAEAGYTDSVKLLLNSGVSSACIDKQYIAKLGHIDILKLLGLNYDRAYEFIEFCLELGFIVSDDFNKKLENKEKFVEIQLIGYHHKDIREIVFVCISDHFHTKNTDCSDTDTGLVYFTSYEGFKINIVFSDNINKKRAACHFFVLEKIRRIAAS